MICRAYNWQRNQLRRSKHYQTSAYGLLAFTRRYMLVRIPVLCSGIPLFVSVGRLPAWRQPSLGQKKWQKHKNKIFVLPAALLVCFLFLSLLSFSFICLFVCLFVLVSRPGITQESVLHATLVSIAVPETDRPIGTPRVATTRDLVVLSGSFTSHWKSVRRLSHLRGHGGHERYTVSTVEGREINFHKFCPSGNRTPDRRLADERLYPLGGCSTSPRFLLSL